MSKEGYLMHPVRYNCGFCSEKIHFILEHDADGPVWKHIGTGRMACERVAKPPDNSWALYFTAQF